MLQNFDDFFKIQTLKQISKHIDKERAIFERQLTSMMDGWAPHYGMSCRANQLTRQELGYKADRDLYMPEDFDRYKKETISWKEKVKLKYSP